jgi:hypothetical protein
MKSMPQHACEACNELVATIRSLKHEFQRVKRLPAAEMADAWNLLQAQFGSLEQQATDMKTFVCVAFATTAVREVPSEIHAPATEPDRQRAAANDHTLTLQI